MFDSLSGKGRNPQDFRAGLSNESREFIRKFPLQANSDRTYQYGDRKLSLTTLYNAREELEKVLAGNATNREFSIAFRWYVNQLQRAGQDGGYIDGAPFLGCTALLQEVQLVKAGTPEAKQLQAYVEGYYQDMMLFDSLIKKFGASSLNGGDVNSFAEYLRKVGVARQAIAVKTGVAQSVKSDTQGSQAGMRPQPNQLPRSDATSVSNRVEQVKVSAPVDNAKLPEAQVQSIVRGIKSGEVRGIRQEHMAQVVEAFISSLQNEVSMLRSVNASNEAVRTKANEMRANVTDVKDVIARSLLAPATIESYIGKFNDIERVLKEIVAANQEMSAVRRQLTSRELVAVNELIKNQEWDKIDPNDFLACVDRFINDLQRDEEAPVLFTDVPSLVYLDRAATLMQSYPPLAQSVLDQARTAMTYYMRYQSLIFSFKNNPTFTQRMVEAGSRMRPLYDRLLTIELSAAKFARER